MCSKNKSLLSMFMCILILCSTTYASIFKMDHSFVEEDTFEEYISGYESLINDKQFISLQKEYESIESAINNGQITDRQYNDKMNQFDERLRKVGISIPYKTLSSFLYTIKNISQEDKQFFLENERYFIPEDSTDTQSYEIEEEVWEKGVEILKKYHLDLEEVLAQLQNANYHFALFDIQDEKIELNKEKSANVKKINKDTQNKYIKVIKQVKFIIPKDIWNKITVFEFNTDGVDNVLAHVVEEDDNSKTFRLALDVNDNLDKDGNLTQAGKETIIHEIGHIITLDNTQISLNNTKSDDEIQSSKEFLEKYQGNAYLYTFFDRYWKENFKEYLLTNISEEKEEVSTFYEKHKAEFVSDYAATNPEEDIAESFRIFVFEDKPIKQSVRDKKVLFFYEYGQFIKWREEIRTHLSSLN